MKRIAVLLSFAVIVALSFLCAAPSIAQDEGGGRGSDQGPQKLDPSIKTTFVHLGPGVPGLFYEPVSPGAKSQIGILVMHDTGDMLAFLPCTELSKRGYRVLCANTTASKILRGQDEDINRTVLDVKFGVAWLRKYPGIRKVLIFGQSGGGALMSAYQYVAETGLKGCQGPEKLIKCSDKLAGLPPADGVMLVDSNWGLAAMSLFSVDPAVINNANGQKVNPDLNLFNPKNGFNPKGSDYSQEFINKFQSAVGKRENELIKTAQDRLKVIEAGQGDFADDEPFVAAGTNREGGNNLLFSQDTRLMSHTHNAWPLLHADGSITTQVVPSVRVPANPTSHTALFEDGAIVSTVRYFLSTAAIRTTADYGFDEDSVQGVDWNSTISCPAGNVEGITVPLLTMGMTGHWEYLAAETIYEHAKSPDKTIAFVEGALHGFTPCKVCEKTPGEFGDTVKTTFDFVDTWLSKPGRF